MAGVCLREYTDKCVTYTGPDIQCAGLVHGKSYDKVVVDMANTLCEYLNETVELQCLFTDSCDSFEVTIPEAVEKIIAKICTLTSEDVFYNGSLFCIGEGSISGEATALVGRSVVYTTEPTTNGLSFSFDLSNAAKNLPNGFLLSSTRVHGVGSNSNTIFDTNRISAGFKISNQKFPIVVDFEITVSTPNGRVILERSVNIPTPSRTNKTVTLSVRDLTSSPAGVMTDAKVLEMLAAQVCENTTNLEDYRYISITDCDEIQYPSNDIKDVVSIQSSELCDVKSRLEDIGSEKIQVADCDGNVAERTITQAVMDLTLNQCSMLQNLNTLDANLKLLERRVDECCIKSTGSSGSLIGGGGSSRGTSSSSSRGTVGPCPGGICF